MNGLKITSVLLWLCSLSLTFAPLQCEGFFKFFKIQYNCPEDPDVHFKDTVLDFRTGRMVHIAEDGIFEDTSFYDCNTFARVYTSPAGVNLNAIEEALEPTYIVVVGDSGTIVTNTPGPWTIVPSPTNRNLNALCETFISSANIVYAVGDSGTIITSTDQGLTWSLLPSPTTSNLNDVQCSGRNVYLAGDDVAGFHSSDNGATWRQYNFYMSGEAPSSPSGPPDLYSMVFVDSRRGFAFGEFGVAFRTLDSGNTWLSGLVPGFSAINTSYFINGDTGAVAGDNGMISFTTDGGQSWFTDSTMSSLTTHNINSIAVYDSTLVSIVGDSGTVIYFSDDSSRVTSVATTPGVPAGYALFQNYPNPFNPSTTIEFSIPRMSHVSVRVYDLLGSEVATLLSEERTAGTHAMQWNVTGLASGIYFYRMKSGPFSDVKKLLLLR